jgi:hypothetical protein
VHIPTTPGLMGWLAFSAQRISHIICMVFRDTIRHYKLSFMLQRQGVQDLRSTSEEERYNRASLVLLVAILNYRHHLVHRCVLGIMMVKLVLLAIRLVPDNIMGITFTLSSLRVTLCHSSCANRPLEQRGEL